MTRPDIDKLMEQVEYDPESGCLVYTGYVGPNGYGRATINGKRDTIHRHAHRIFIGPIPDGLNILHACDNRRCIHPGHISAGTQQENIAQAVARGRMSYGALHYMKRPEYKGCRAGSKNCGAKLDEDDVRTIRELKRGGVPVNALAAASGVTAHQIHRIIKGDRWKAVTA